MVNDSRVGHFVVQVPYRVLYVGAAVSILVVMFWLVSLVSASATTYAPSSCTGDWGEPASALHVSDDSLFAFRDAQAAILSLSEQKLFCAFGGVTAGESRAIVAAELVLHFVPATYLAEEPPIEEMPEGVVLRQEVASPDHATGADPLPAEASETTETLKMGPEGETTAGTPEEPTPDADAPPAPSPRESPKSAPPAPETAPEPVTQSLVHRLALMFSALAYAQTEPAPAESVVRAVPVMPGASPIPGDTGDHPGAAPRVIVSYSTDATGWKELGAVTGDDLARVVRIALPLSTAADIETLVIRLNGKSIRGDIYLDGITLEVAYEELQTPESPSATGNALAEAVAAEDRTVSVLELNDATVFAILETQGTAGLFRVSEEGTGRIITEIAGAGVSTSTTLFLKEGWVFWIAGDDMLHAYDAYSGSRHASRLVYDDEAGDTIALIPAFPMTVISRDASLFFWTPEGAEESYDAQSREPREELLDTTPPEAAAILPAISPAAPVPEPMRPAPTHVCSVEPFSVQSEEVSLLVTFARSENVRSTALIGRMPQGIEATFYGSGTSTLEMAAGGSLAVIASIGISFTSDAARGNYTIPIVFTQHGEYDSNVICQFNVVR